MLADYGGFAAWVVSQANEYARHHGLAQFVVYQGLWNLGVRDLERDVIPMARANGMSIGKSYCNPFFPKCQPTNTPSPL